MDIHDAFGQNEYDYCGSIDWERQVDSLYCIDCSMCKEGVKHPDAIAFGHLNRKTIQNIFGYSQSMQEYLSITCKDRYPLSVFLYSGLWQGLHEAGIVEALALALELDPQSDDYIGQVSAAVFDPLVSESCCGAARNDGKTIRDPGLVLGDGFTCEFLDWSVASAHGLWQINAGETDCERFKRTVPSTNPELSFAEGLRVLGRECGCSNQKSSATGRVALSSTASAHEVKKYDKRP